MATIVPAFFPREKPISRSAKPACMKSTRQAATKTHIELIPTVSGTPTASKTSADATVGAASSAKTLVITVVISAERFIGPPD